MLINREDCTVQKRLLEFSTTKHTLLNCRAMFGFVKMLCIEVLKLRVLASPELGQQADEQCAHVGGRFGSLGMQFRSSPDAGQVRNEIC